MTYLPQFIGERKATILVVDDTPENLQLINALLREKYKLRLANDGALALELVHQEPQPDLILLDINMPGLDGYEVCRRLKTDHKVRSIPVIFLTALDSDTDQEKGFQLGCVDYITKPVSPPLLLARVATHVTLKNATDLLSDQNEYLLKEVSRRTNQVEKVQDVTIMAMASLAETRDNDTGMHIRRTQNYVKALADELHRDSPYANYFNAGVINALYKSAPLHDIGKVGIPDDILLKPGRLSVDEFEIMKRHTILGARIIESAESLLDESSSFLRFAREIAHSHHENWDGSGYPDGLAGDAIPLSARLMALADVYDALISRRCYKLPFDHQEAASFIQAQTGLKFDPIIVMAFQQISEQFSAIAATYRDRH